MKHARACSLFGVFFLFGLLCGFNPFSAQSAFLYKDYVIHRVQGQEVLCEPYAVRKNDYVLKLLRQKGEIAHTDFPAFLQIFEQINPHIRDIDQIRPGQRIYIPLKKLQPDSMPGQASGVVTIPFVMLDQKRHDGASSSVYRAVPGDCVSVLIAERFGSYGSRDYREGIRLFRELNPAVTDIHFIRVGQQLHLPNPERPSPDTVPLLPDNAAAPELTAAAHPPPGAAASEELPAGNPLTVAAAALDAALMDRGVYYFPSPDGTDWQMDLERFPVLTYQNRRILFADSAGRNEIEKAAEKIRRHWPNAEIRYLAPDASTGDVLAAVLESAGRRMDPQKISFTDGGVEVSIKARWVSPSAGDFQTRRCLMPVNRAAEMTPRTIRDYLAQNGIVLQEFLQSQGGSAGPAPKNTSHGDLPPAETISLASRREFVKSLLTVLGCSYAPDVPVMFPYAGIQVQAVTNLAAAPDGREFLIDFGEFYGDAVAAIRQTGLKVLQIPKHASFETITEKVLSQTGLDYEKNPRFAAADRSLEYNTHLMIPGFLIPAAKRFLSTAPLNPSLAAFLHEKGYHPVIMGGSS